MPKTIDLVEVDGVYVADDVSSSESRTSKSRKPQQTKAKIISQRQSHLKRKQKDALDQFTYGFRLIANWMEGK